MAKAKVAKTSIQLIDELLHSIVTSSNNFVASAEKNLEQGGLAKNTSASIKIAVAEGYNAIATKLLAIKNQAVKEANAKTRIH